MGWRFLKDPREGQGFGEAMSHYTEEEEFFDLMQAYRHSDKFDQPCVCAAFDAVCVFIKEQESARADLLEALKTVRDSTAVLNHLDTEHQQMIEVAIARAEGKTKKVTCHKCGEVYLCINYEDGHSDCKA